MFKIHNGGALFYLNDIIPENMKIYPVITQEINTIILFLDAD